MKTDMKAKRAAYREALLMLAGLVDDLSPSGDVAYRLQERECERLRDEIYYDERRLFDLPGQDFADSVVGELGDDLPPAERPADKLPWE